MNSDDRLTLQALVSCFRWTLFSIIIIKVAFSPFIIFRDQKECEHEGFGTEHFNLLLHLLHEQDVFIWLKK